MSTIYQEVITGIVSGVSGRLIHVEVEIRNGLPYFTMVGYLSKESMEAKERVASALRSIGHPLPSMKITVNLSPANIRKNGTAFDFPIAVAFLGCLNLIDAVKLDDICIMGELGLNGKIRGVGNCLPIVLEARKQGIHKFFAAREDENSLRGIEDIEVIFMDTLQDVLDYFHGTYKSKAIIHKIDSYKEEYEEDFSDIIGQQHLKRAVEIAVAGRHHLLIIGSPGSGKTMAAKRIPTILPPLSKEEKMEVQAIYDATGIPRYLEDDTRPFRQPHPLIPKAAFLGGGRIPKAGEITLAHHGILFMDEFMEFKTECIEALRQPLEDGTIDLTRNGIFYRFPADFQLIATSNPCLCGYALEDGVCRCTFNEKKRYLKKLSGPILDRFDMILCLTQRDISKQKTKEKEIRETSNQIKKRIDETIQREKNLLKNSKCSAISHLSHIQLKKIIHLSKECQEILDIAYQSGKITRRGMDKILKVALTIMLTENETEIKPIHLMEAMTFRNTDFIKEVLEYGR